jgi:hypothetical protein
MTMLPSKDGSERARLRRCIERLGIERVCKILQLNRSTVAGFAAGAGVQLATECLIVLRLPDVEREAERGR